MQRFIVISCGLLIALAGGPLGAQGTKKIEVPDPEPLTLRTKDMLQIHARFYPGGFLRTADGAKKIDGKTVVPIILLHGWGGKRQDFDYLASGLQSLGHAVIVPDLRGHGRSTVARDAAGNEVTIDPDRFRSVHFEAMVSDVVACKRHLMKLNNKGELNIELLSVVGSDMGALVALYWMAYDWTRPLLPTIKQGQDVKLFVLLSPPKSFKGLSANMALRRHPAIKSTLYGLIIAGTRDRKGHSDAAALHKSMAKTRSDPPDGLFFLEADTSLGGVQLVNARRLKVAGKSVAENIAKFIDVQLARKAEDFPWRDRTSPLSD